MKGKNILVRTIFISSIILFAFISANTMNICSQGNSLPSFLIDPYLFEVEEHSIKVDIQTVDEILVSERFTVRNTQNVSLNSIELWINQSLSDITVRDYNGSLSFDNSEVTQSSHLLEINFRLELTSNSSTTFDIRYILNREPVSEHGNSHYFFEFYSTVNYFTIEQSIEVKIPERSFIHEEDGLTPYFPSDGYALAGQRVYLSWTFENLDPLEETFIFVRFDKPIRETPVIAIVFGSIGGLILGAGATILFMRRREKKVVKQISTIYLSETQKTLLHLILENNGRMLQKEICAETGFTKSRVSRNITPLIEQGLIERDQWGRNYVIKLTESGRKVIE